MIKQKERYIQLEHLKWTLKELKIKISIKI